MSHIQIQPKTIYGKGLATQLDWSVTSYPRNGTMVQVGYTLMDNNGHPIDDNVLTLGSDVVADWDDDDSVITNAIAELLNITIS